MLIAVDIDGILTVETEGYGEIAYTNRTPQLDAIQIVNQQKGKGNTIILYTARYPEDKKVTVAWLKRYKVKYDRIIFGKLQYDLLIDDKAQSNLEGL